MSTEGVHRLGALLCAVAGLCWLVRSLGAARRERRLRGRMGAVLSLEAVPSGRRLAVLGALRRWLPVAGVVCAGWVLVEGVAGLLVGVAAGFAVRWWARRRGNRPVRETDDLARESHDPARESHEPARQPRDPVQVAGQLPLAADLLAACITAGASPVAAAQAVGDALGGPVGERLCRGAAQLRLGGEPTEAWRALGALPGAGRLARLLERADESGVPAAAPVARLAADARAERGRAATGRARRAAVMVTVPVGLCFLPAFIVVGVLPVVIGLAGGLLGGGG
ncbi:type II secretion system F family protein [Streptomyces poonensis]|uniref:Membrane protein n=1 Tax=Streptomyces poonensis TaxID=68255 RepID=A0A918PLN4_9ACTN|nr:type II secretion system F family protein [Streptomyces poonensis]GGZ13871.1 membrane protein [Streptomyces poonensis]